jgi:hypothetical protein
VNNGFKRKKWGKTESISFLILVGELTVNILYDLGAFFSRCG